MMAYQIPDAEYFGESMGNDIYAYTEKQLLDAYSKGREDALSEYYEDIKKKESNEK